MILKTFMVIKIVNHGNLVKNMGYPQSYIDEINKFNVVDDKTLSGY